jgi:hypothetical protein
MAPLMTLATGKAQSLRRAAFTLIEILLVLSLFVALAGMVIGNLDNVIRAAGVIPPQLHFNDMLSEAKLIAQETGQLTTLTFDAASGAFLLSAGTSAGHSDQVSGVFKETHPDLSNDPAADERPGPGPEAFGADTAPSQSQQRYPGLEVAFYAVASTENGFSDSAEPLPEPVDGIECWPTGFHTPVEVVFTDNNGEQTRWRVDPFSAGPQPSREALQRR